MTALPPEVLHELQKEYLESFDDLLKQIKTALDASDWRTIENQFHKFAGSGATYGLPLISDIARDLEMYLIKKTLPERHIVVEHIEKFQNAVDNYKNQMGFKKSG